MRGMVSSRSLRECASISWIEEKTCGALFESGAVVGSTSSREGTAATRVGVACTANEGGRKDRCSLILSFASETLVYAFPDHRCIVPRVWTRGQPAEWCKGLKRRSWAGQVTAALHRRGRTTARRQVVSVYKRCFLHRSFNRIRALLLPLLWELLVREVRGRAAVLNLRSLGLRHPRQLLR